MPILEKEVQRRIEAKLGAEPDLLLLRNSVGRAKYVKEDKVFYVPYGLGVGSPDLVFILRTPFGLGVWLCMEVKVPGEEPEPEQERCHEIWRRFGALIYVVHSVDEAVAALKDARAIVHGTKKETRHG